MKALRVEATWDPKPGYVLKEREKLTRRAYNSSQVWRYPKVELVDVPDPKIEAPDEVLIRVMACGVCGSDVHIIESDEEGYMFFPGHTKLPNIIGHEWAGRIEEVGPEVKDLQPGDLVAVEEICWCGECTPCRGGHLNKCANLEETGMTLPGAYAEYVVTKAKYCWSLNDLLEVYGREERVCEAGALVEPTAGTFQGMFLRTGGFLPGGYVVIFGAGPIGLAAIALARLAGAAQVIVFELSAPRIEMARQMGADHVLNPEELAAQGSSPHQAIMDITKGLGAAMLVEAAGNPLATIPEMEKSIAINGTIALIGLNAVRTPMDLTAIQFSNSQLYGSIGNSGLDNWPSVIRLMATGRLDLTPIITDHYPLTEVLKAIHQAAEGQDGKIMVKP